MKKLFVLICICALFMFGCSSRNDVSNAQDGESESQSQLQKAQEGSTTPQSSSQALKEVSDEYSKIIKELSIYRLEDFAKPAEAAPDQLVNFFFLANYDGEGKLPIPEGYRQSDGFTLVFPSEEVESFVTKYFDVSADYIQKAQGFSKKGYEIPSTGMAQNSVVRTTDVDSSDKANIKITFEVDATITDESGNTKTISPAVRRVLTLDMSQGVKLKSLKTTFTAQIN